MIELLVKYITLVICSFYIYCKLLNIKLYSKYLLYSLLLGIGLSLATYYTLVNFQPLFLPILIVNSLICFTLSTKTETGLSITTTTISFAISFSLFSIAALVTAIIFRFLGAHFSETLGKAAYICTAMIQAGLCMVPFKFRRLKRGMPFLQNKGGGNRGVIISTVLLCCFIVISNVNNAKSLFFIVPVIFVFLCGAYIFIWWRKRLQNAYIEKLRRNELLELQKSIDEKDMQIKKLRQDNDNLAKIVHKDNKLIPAMELAVREYLQSFNQNNLANIQLTGQNLLEQLNLISQERSGILTEYQAANKSLPLTGVFQIDALITYMYNKAKANRIHFDLTVTGSVKYMVDNIISVSDLRTILADLIENAIIASRYCEKKEILISIEVLEGFYRIDIFDSGIPFEPQTLANFGRKKTTTHANTGGSGIGLMTLSEILNSYGASFMIEEFPQNDQPFSKKVSVRFDNLNQFIVQSREPFCNSAG